jgi:hypothetical protein
MPSLDANALELIRRVVRSELRKNPRDLWVNATDAAEHLKMSRHHFLRLCRGGLGPEGCGTSQRLKRWRVSTLDGWMEHAKQKGNP